MKIAIDISQVVYAGSGVARFTEGLIRAICEYDTKNEWVFFFSSFRRSLDSSIETLIKSKGHTLIKTKLPPTLLSCIWNQLHIFSIDNFIGKADWLITSDWAEPPTKCKKATIVHDLIYFKFPETVDEVVRKTQEQRLRWVQKESSVIFADSDSTKFDLESLLTINRNRITVNYPGIEQPKVLSIKYQVSSSRPFILTVGKLEPRKNIEKLVKAFNSLNQEKIDLYVVGMNGWGNVVIEQSSQVKLLGFVTDQELAELYKTCLFFVLPSIYEGFGYPIAEAMSYGAPVATSNSSSMREISGDAGLLFDPNDEDSIAEALKKLIQSSKLRGSLAKKGLLRAKDFSWKKYYETMITVLSSKL